jgi:hypothetical protein
MKKLLFVMFLILIFTSGCTTYNIDNLTYDEIIKNTLSSNLKLNNINNLGYRYYLPRGFIVSENKKYNQVLFSNNSKYYLNVDIISYYNKTDKEHEKDTSFYYSYDFEINDKKGYLDIKKSDDVFYVKMLYNYAIIEALVEEKDIKKAITNMSYILSSIRYNDSVILNLIGDSVFNTSQYSYQIEKVNSDEEVEKNFLDYVSDNTDENEIISDPDFIEN